MRPRYLPAPLSPPTEGQGWVVVARRAGVAWAVPSPSGRCRFIGFCPAPLSTTARRATVDRLLGYLATVFRFLHPCRSPSPPPPLSYFLILPFYFVLFPSPFYFFLFTFYFFLLSRPRHSSSVEIFPGSCPNARAFRTRLIIFPERVLGKESTSSICSGLAIGPTS